MNNLEKLRGQLIELVQIIRDFAQAVENNLPESKKRQEVHILSSSVKRPREEYFHRFITSTTDRIEKFNSLDEISIGKLESFSAFLGNDRHWVSSSSEYSVDFLRIFTTANTYLSWITGGSLVKVPNWTSEVKNNWKNLFRGVGLDFPLILTDKKKPNYSLKRAVLKNYVWKKMLTCPLDSSDSWENRLKRYLVEDIFPRLEALDFNLAIEVEDKEKIKTYDFSGTVANQKKLFTNLFNWITKNEVKEEVENEWLKNKIVEFSKFFINQLGMTGWDKNDYLKNFVVEAWEVRKIISELDYGWIFPSRKEEMVKKLLEGGIKESEISEVLVELVSNDEGEEKEVLEGSNSNLDFLFISPLIFKDDRFDKVFKGVRNSFFYPAELKLDKLNAGDQGDTGKENENINEDENEHQNTTPPAFSEQADHETEQKNQHESAKKEAQINEALKGFQETDDINEKLEKLETAEKNAEDQSYQKIQDQIKTSWAEVIAKDKEKSTQSIIKILTEQMNINEIVESELDNETNEKLADLKNQVIQEPDQITATKQEVSQRIGELGAWKRYSRLVSKAKEACRSDKSKKKEVYDELVIFLFSTNIYDKNLISQKKNELKKIREDLKNSTNQQPSGSGSPKGEIPWKIVVPIVLVGVVFLGLVIILRKKRWKRN